MAQFKKQNAMISDTELSWIGSIGQSFDGLLAPLILFLARPSSTIDNLHWILLTYSIPYGFANSVIFILGTLVCGLYYPVSQYSKHILVMCIISTGFPMGYHIMSALIF
ncbi:unnamed protein product [Rotaria magnacalcarata]|uniref:Uncharacterized protein n=1 Tax=Rotaria magnacalcarata TaxID=392030 RepID=A0A816W692_9BILA|nr:unnamed protein product [Rotaria magnacalcarata]CAF4077007.1 unnamed protein product [Rotaria magnacalcarata]CAF4109439.1 unnamed protein product [Rotaria magnacalcarata]CAF4857058.1 unnamed protein product [Rotaria magnacalcarata]